MVLKTFAFYDDKNRKTKISVEVCDTTWKKFRGLMFRKKSPPLLFIFNKESTLSIHSLFCIPFKAIWLDDKKQVTKTEIVVSPRLHISGRGKYLLEIPLPSRNRKV